MSHCSVFLIWALQYFTVRWPGNFRSTFATVVCRQWSSNSVDGVVSSWPYPASFVRWSAIVQLVFVVRHGSAIGLLYCFYSTLPSCLISSWMLNWLVAPMLTTRKYTAEFFTHTTFLCCIDVLVCVHVARFHLLSKQWSYEWQFFRSAVFRFLLRAVRAHTRHTYIYTTWKRHVSKEFTQLYCSVHWTFWYAWVNGSR